jgi:carbonic anhydrase
MIPAFGIWILVHKAIMCFSHSILALILVASLHVMTSANEGTFSYDPADELGPAHWANIAVPNNQCGGIKNSPIAILSAACDTYQDYEFHVSSFDVVVQG